MKKFLLRLVILVIPLIMLVLLFDSFLRDMNTLGTEKYYGFLNEAEHIESLVLGSSQATYAVNPIMFNKPTYNIANLSQRFYFDKRIVLKHLNDLNQLKYVMISIDFHTLYSSSMGVNNNAISYYVNGIKYKDQNYKKAIMSPFLFGYGPKLSFLLFLKKMKNNIIGRNMIDFDVEDGVSLQDTLAHGYIGRAGQNNLVMNESRFYSKATTYNHIVQQSTEFSEIKKDLIDFIEILQDRDIEPIFFSSPIYIKYHELLDEKYIYESSEAIRNICMDYNIKYFDYSNHEIFTKTDFYDCNHLNKTGAKKFSAILNKLLNN
jgi:hypothetical protein